MTVGRIRVLIAGNIYVKRALVRRFLEDDGYEVVAETYDQREVMPAIRRGEPNPLLEVRVGSHGYRRRRR